MKRKSWIKELIMIILYNNYYILSGSLFLRIEKYCGLHEVYFTTSYSFSHISDAFVTIYKTVCHYRNIVIFYCSYNNFSLNTWTYLWVSCIKNRICNSYEINIIVDYNLLLHHTWRLTNIYIAHIAH